MITSSLGSTGGKAGRKEELHLLAIAQVRQFIIITHLPGGHVVSLPNVSSSTVRAERLIRKDQPRRVKEKRNQKMLESCIQGRAFGKKQIGIKETIKRFVVGIKKQDITDKWGDHYLAFLFLFRCFPRLVRLVGHFLSFSDFCRSRFPFSSLVNH